MPEPPSAPAAERNFGPLLGVLRCEFADRRQVLEFGSGTGQHAAGFARAMPWLSWQPSDLPARLDDIRAWVARAGLTNLRQPLAIDLRTAELPVNACDAAFTANTLHIMAEGAGERLFEELEAALEPGGRLCVYGPFAEDGVFSTASNARFDAQLRQGDSAMGIRDLRWVEANARRCGLEPRRRYAMPANNLLLVFDAMGEGA